MIKKIKIIKNVNLKIDTNKYDWNINYSFYERPMTLGEEMCNYVKKYIPGKIQIVITLNEK